MLRLILRQILKHRGPLFVLLILWGAAGYFFYRNSHWLLARLASWTIDLPDPGSQDPATAYSYVIQAREHADGVRLDLMTRTCAEFLPLSYTGSIEDFRPHWLDKLRNWSVITDDGRQVVEPDLYWKEHIDNVLLALRSSISALQFAYEIDGENQADPKAETLIVPDLVAQYAAAACRRELAILAYGDYADFQEKRAWRKILGGDPGRADSDERGIGPRERERLILEQLRGAESYIRALREYLGGPPPDPHDLRACDGDLSSRQRSAYAAANGRDFRLACVAPQEAIDVYQKLIQVSGADAAAPLHRDAGLLRILAARKSPAPAAERHLKAAIEHLTIASAAYETEFEARLELARLYLNQATESETRGDNPQLVRESYTLAFDEVRQLALLSRRRDFREREFREVARRALMGLGRFREADCFADMRDLRYGARTHCVDLTL